MSILTLGGTYPFKKIIETVEKNVRVLTKDGEALVNIPRSKTLFYHSRKTGGQFTTISIDGVDTFVCRTNELEGPSGVVSNVSQDVDEIAVSSYLETFIGKTTLELIEGSQASNPDLSFTDGSLDVMLSDPTTPPFDFFFTQALSPPTTTTVAAVVDEYTITVDNPAIFTVGNLVGLFTGGTLASRYYWAEILDITGSVLTFDSPIDYPFEIGSTVLPTNRNMAVDGSVTPQVFSIQTGSTPLRIDVTRVLVAMKTLTPPAQGEFGDIPELTRGIVLRKTDGENRNYWNVKSNFGLSVLTGTDTKIFEEIKVNDVNGVVARWTLGGQDKHGAVVRIGPNDSLDLIVQDDLTGLVDVVCIASGSEVSDN